MAPAQAPRPASPASSGCFPCMHFAVAPRGRPCPESRVTDLLESLREESAQLRSEWNRDISQLEEVARAAISESTELRQELASVRAAMREESAVASGVAPGEPAGRQSEAAALQVELEVRERRPAVAQTEPPMPGPESATQTEPPVPGPESAVQTEPPLPCSESAAQTEPPVASPESATQTEPLVVSPEASTQTEPIAPATDLDLTQFSAPGMDLDVTQAEPLAEPAEAETAATKDADAAQANPSEMAEMFRELECLERALREERQRSTQLAEQLAKRVEDCEQTRAARKAAEDKLEAAKAAHQRDIGMLEGMLQQALDESEGQVKNATNDLGGLCIPIKHAFHANSSNLLEPEGELIDSDTRSVDQQSSSAVSARS